MERVRHKPDWYKPLIVESNKEDEETNDLVDTDDEEEHNNVSQIDLEQESDNEQEFDFDEKDTIGIIESQQHNDDDDDDDSFMSKNDECKELLTGQTSTKAMFVHTTLGSGNTDEIERELITREMAHHNTLDDNSVNEDYQPVSLEDIKRKAGGMTDSISESY